MCVCVVRHFSHVRLFAMLWTIPQQAPLSIGILQARILECVAMSSSRGSSRPRNQTSSLLRLLHWQAGSLLLAPSRKLHTSFIKSWQFFPEIHSITSSTLTHLVLTFITVCGGGDAVFKQYLYWSLKTKSSGQFKKTFFFKFLLL